MRHFLGGCVRVVPPVTGEVGARVLMLLVPEAITIRDVRYVWTLIGEYCP